MNRIRPSAVLTILGLTVVSFSVLRPHVYSFMAFAMIGVPAIVGGALLFVMGRRRGKHL